MCLPCHIRCGAENCIFTAGVGLFRQGVVDFMFQGSVMTVHFPQKHGQSLVICGGVFSNTAVFGSGFRIHELHAIRQPSGLECHGLGRSTAVRSGIVADYQILLIVSGLPEIGVHPVYRKCGGRYQYHSGSHNNGSDCGFFHAKSVPFHRRFLQLVKNSGFFILIAF